MYIVFMGSSSEGGGVFIGSVAPLGFNTPPLGAVTAGGYGGFVPPYTQRFLSEIFDTP